MFTEKQLKDMLNTASKVESAREEIAETKAKLEGIKERLEDPKESAAALEELRNMKLLGMFGKLEASVRSLVAVSAEADEKGESILDMDLQTLRAAVEGDKEGK